MTLRRASAALAFGVAVVLGACGVGPDDEARAMHVEDADHALPLRPADDVDADAGDIEVPASVYLITDAGLLRSTARTVPAATDPAEHLAAVLEALVEGPGAAEARAGLRSAVPSTSEVRSVALDDGTAIVDLSSQFASVGGRQELLAVGQVVLTATTFPGVQRLEVRLAGRPTALPLPDGSLTEEPVTLRDYAELLAPDPSSPNRVPR